MSETERLDLGKLTKEIIANRLKDITDAPSVAAEVVKKTIVAGVQATRARGEDPRLTVQDICHGAMMGLLLIDKDLPAAASGILSKLSEVAAEICIDPQELLTWAMEGIAKIAPMAQRDVMYRIRATIDRQYMGVGEVFDKLVAKASKK